MMRKYFKIITLLFLALTCAGTFVCAQEGSSCNNPIAFGKNYSAEVSGACTRWYTGNTFDLPFTVKFYPSNSSDPAPEIKLDFSCTPGVYEDEILCGFFCKDKSAYMPMPYTVPTPSPKTDGAGRTYYEMEMAEQYRDMLLRAGISYNVVVYVQVTFYGGGSINVTPDEMSTCLESENWIVLGQTNPIAANDDETFYIASYSHWTNDSVRYVWSGTQPATVAIGTTCDFDPLDDTDSRRIEVMHMAAQDTVKHSKARVLALANSIAAPGGVYYVKAVSEEAGTLKVEHIPALVPIVGAEELVYDQATTVRANDIDALYAIPNTWNAATRFDTPTDHVFKMYIGTTLEFTTQEAIATYQFNKSEDGHWLGLQETDWTTLWQQTTGQYLYVRFECTDNTTVTPTLWTVSDCVGSTTLLQKNSTIKVGTREKKKYRIYLNDWKDGEMTIEWDKTAVCKVLVSGSCDIGTSNGDNIIAYDELQSGHQSYHLTAEEVNAWASAVDADGYIYMRFFTTSGAGGNISINSAAPEEVDPLAECEPTFSEDTQEVCDSLFWNGEWLKESSDYTFETKNAAGCDSTATLHLTVHHSYEITLQDTAVCESFVWEGKGEVEDLTIDRTDTYVREFKSVNGCDSTVTRYFTVNHASFSEDTQEVCDSLFWNGEWLKESSDYTFETKNAAGCDSTATLHLTVHHSYEITLQDTAVCESFVWEGKGDVEDLTIDRTDTYVREFKSVNGCDSTVTRFFTVNHASFSEDTQEVCDSLFWNGEWRRESSDYTFETKNAAGCDSTATLHLTVHHSYEITLQDTAVCESFIWEGKGDVEDLTIDQTGTYVREFKSVNGCDSTVTRYFTVNHASFSEDTQEVCDSLFWNGEWLKESSDYTFETKNAAGCDSTATLHLTVHHSYEITLQDTAVCESFVWEGKGDVEDLTIDRTDTYVREFKSVNNCDSTVTRFVKFLNVTPETIRTDTTVCDTIVQIQWRGKTFAVEDLLKDTLRSVCDFDSVYYNMSVFTRHCEEPCPDLLTITADTIVCDTLMPYRWRDTLYTEPARYEILYKDRNGCDSLLNIFTLDTQPCCPEIVVLTFDSLVCDTLLPFTWIIDDQTFVFNTIGTQQLDVAHPKWADCIGTSYTLNLDTYHCEREDPGPDPQPTLYPIIVNKYNWYLLVDNVTLRNLFPNRTVMAFQWFKNDEPIVGATDDDYSEQGELRGRFQLRVELDGNQIIWSNILAIGEEQPVLPITVHIYNSHGMPIGNGQVTHGIYLYHYQQGDKQWTEKKLIP